MFVIRGLSLFKRNQQVVFHRGLARAESAMWLKLEELRGLNRAVVEIERDEEDLPTWRRVADRSALKSEGRIKQN
jgi:hypothetical protein